MTTDTHESAQLHHLTRSAHKIIPHLRCADVTKTAAFYTDHLYFEIGGLKPEVPMVSVFMGAKADANIYIFQNPSGERISPGTIIIGLRRAELERYDVALVEEGRVEIVHEIADRPWEFRQFDVKDLDANVLQFFAFMSE